MKSLPVLPSLCPPKYPIVIGIKGYTHGVRLRASPPINTKSRLTAVARFKGCRNWRFFFRLGYRALWEIQVIKQALIYKIYLSILSTTLISSVSLTAAEACTFDRCTPDNSIPTLFYNFGRKRRSILTSRLLLSRMKNRNRLSETERDFFCLREYCFGKRNFPLRELIFVPIKKSSFGLSELICHLFRFWL